jgi:branched-chain amino acid transport system substrate-binding protein
LTKDPSILAVIGHNASNASLEAAPIYQQEKLVMVTPTSFANNLSGFGSYIFRTVPNISLMAAPLAEYAVKTDAQLILPFVMTPKHRITYHLKMNLWHLLLLLAAN